MRAFFTIVAVVAAFVGCDSKQVWPPSAQAVKEIQSDYDAALADATNSIPYAADFARVFPGAWGSFSYFIGGAGASTFNLEVLLFDRYELTMKVSVTFKEGQRKIQSFGDPEFLLLEVSKVEKIRKVGVRPDGSPAVAEQLSLSSNRQQRFGTAEWKKIVESGGDFSVIGFPLITNSPAPGFEDFRKDWELRRQKQP